MAEPTDRAGVYQVALNGRFEGILTWPDFDALWARLRSAPAGWFVHDTEADQPAHAATPEAFAAALDRAEEMFAHARSRSWCGAVYVDDPGDPALVKLFDPHGMAACGGGGGASRPRYILSRIPPAHLSAGGTRSEKRGWFRRR